MTTRSSREPGRPDGSGSRRGARLREVLVARMLVCLGLVAVLAVPGHAQETRSTLDRIKDTGVISLGFRESSIPFSFLDKDRKPAGYSVDLCARVATSVQQRLGLRDLKVNWVVVTPADRIPSIVRGAIDLECGSSTVTFSRMEQVDFSHMIFVDGGSLLATAASRIERVGDLAGKRVAVIPGTTTEKALATALQRAIIQAQMITVSEHADGLAVLEAGKADAYASDHMLLAGLLLKAREPDKLRLSSDLFSYEPYGLMLRRGDGPFRVQVNRVLSSLYRSGEIVPVYERWFGPFRGAGPLLQALYLLHSLPE